MQMHFDNENMFMGWFFLFSLSLFYHLSPPSFTPPAFLLSFIRSVLFSSGKSEGNFSGLPDASLMAAQ